MLTNVDEKYKRLISWLMVIVGNCIYALSVKLFVLPANLISCGTTGIALVVNQLTGIPISEFIFVFNVAMLALGWWVLGRQFAMTTIISSLFYPAALEILNRHQIPYRKIYQYQSDGSVQEVSP